MILDHKQFDLFGKKTFEKIVLEPPFKVSNDMLNEACFMYMEEGGYDMSSELEIASSGGGLNALRKLFCRVPPLRNGFQVRGSDRASLSRYFKKNF